MSLLDLYSIPINLHESQIFYFYFLLLNKLNVTFRSASFKEDEGTWKGNDDGKVVNNQPQRVMDDRNGLGPQAGYIGKITNDARENEMEENMGQVSGWREQVVGRMDLIKYNRTI